MFFRDRTKDAELTSYNALSLSSAFADHFDHDGDLDIFIAGFADPSKSTGSASVLRFPQDYSAAPNMLLRNNGNGKFTDITEAAQLSAPGKTVSVVPSDYDNRRDVDLVLAALLGSTNSL
ncbi:MAG: VCBS repeat-containing protein [Pyrinomonadaceae bacterium]